jgi:hypothetical protein
MNIGSCCQYGENRQIAFRNSSSLRCGEISGSVLSGLTIWSYLFDFLIAFSLLYCQIATAIIIFATKLGLYDRRVFLCHNSHIQFLCLILAILSLTLVSMSLSSN